jgi:ACS family tartrate transporter-like MFS transporter
MDEAQGRAVIRKATWRLIPFLFVLYVVAYLDRVNVGFAALQMNEALGFNAATYGLGAGIFFLGYFLFEIPSNLILQRVGARFWIARIMVTWGLVAIAMALVQNEPTFYLLRFLLGVAEAGFFPGIILYLTYWFPAEERAKTVALFMTAVAISGVVGGPISGLLLSMHGFAGLDGWHWLFLLEGLPAVVLGVVVWFYLPDGPRHARWLAPAEQEWLEGRLAQERAQLGPHAGHTLREAMSSGRVWLLCLVYFALVVGNYGLGFWLPQIIEGFGKLTDFQIGLISAVPYLVSAVGMVLIARHSDQTGERRWHVAGALGASALGFVIASQSAGAPVLALAALSLAAMGIMGSWGPFWSLPPAFLSGTAAASGIALINAVGNLGGFFGPSIVGYIRNATQSFEGGLLALAAVVLLGGGLVLALRQASAPKRVPEVVGG